MKIMKVSACVFAPQVFRRSNPHFQSHKTGPMLVLPWVDNEETGPMW